MSWAAVSIKEMTMNPRIFAGIIILCVLLGGCAAAPKQKAATADSEEFPESRYLTATGIGESETEARREAVGELSRIFESRVSTEVAATTASFMDGSAGELFEKNVESRIRIESTVNIQGVTIGKVWQDSKSGLFYELAVLDRQQAAREWFEQLDQLTTQLNGEVDALIGIHGRLPRIIALNRILGLVIRKTAVESRLRVIGRPVMGSSDIDMRPIFSEAASLKSDSAFYVRIDGVQGASVSHRLSRALGDNGIPVTEKDNRAAGIIRGELDLVPLNLNNPDVKFIRATAAVKIEDADTGTRVYTISESIRKGHVDGNEAIRMAVEAVSDRTARKLLEFLGVIGFGGDS